MSSFVLTLLALLATSILVLWYYISDKYKYWEKRNVPYLKPTWPFGTFKDRIFFKKHRFEVLHDHCMKFPDAPYIGGFLGLSPILILNDLESVKTILVKKFPYISGRLHTNYLHREAITQFIFFNADDEWKVLRQNMTPIYSSSKMKNMFHLIVEQTHVFEKMIKKEAETKQASAVGDLMMRYTMDCISSCAFGVNSNLMGENSRSNPFWAIRETLFNFNVPKALFKVLYLSSPRLFYLSSRQLFPKWMYIFINKLINDVFEKRQHKPSGRNDFIDLVMNLNKQPYIVGDSLSQGRTGEPKLAKIDVTNELIVSQCFGILVAGFETSATTMMYACYFIAKHEHVQSQVLKEVDDYFKRHKGKLEYDILTELTYLEACLEEALRLAPVASFINREVLYDCELPNGLKLQKGQVIDIPVFSFHRNAKYFSNPDDFRPERFIGEERKNIKPYSFLAFGEGPRICLGARFSKMQTLAGLATLFKNYRLECVEETLEKLTFSRFVIVLHPEKPIYLKFVPRV